MSDISNQVILVTGATDGLGRLVARDLAAHGATVLLHGRDRRKGEAALADIRRATGNLKLTFYDADFSSLDAVRRLADRVTADQRRPNVLINNAGVGPGRRNDPRQESADGLELRFAVNYLAGFLLTRRLLPVLRRSAPARIVNVSSVGQQRLDFDDVMLERGYDGLRAYRQSKLAQVMFTLDLAAELAGSDVTVNCLHPASLMPTKMVTRTDYFERPTGSLEEGARAVERLATSPELDGVTGEYFDGTRRARAQPQAYDAEARRRLRELSERLVLERSHA